MCVNMSSVQFLQSQDEDLGKFCNNNYIFCKMECDYECINQKSPIERQRRENAGKCPHDWFIDYIEQRRGSRKEVEEATS